MIDPNAAETALAFLIPAVFIASGLGVIELVQWIINFDRPRNKRTPTDNGSEPPKDS